jgi:hypothetical protein
MKTKEIMIQPIKLPRSAVYTAVEHYKKYSPVPFKVDLADYLANGFVFSGPTCFALGKIIQLGKNGSKEPAWFIRFACGDFLELFHVLPFYLPKIVFCRHGEMERREYPTERLYKLARAIKLKGEQNGLRA